MDNLKPALEKLFNTLGNQMTDDYYGLTFDFNIKDVKPSDYNHEILKITVSTNPPIPSTLFVEDSPWGYGKFSTGNYLTWNLENLTKYLGLGTDMVVVDVDNMEKVEDFPLGGKFNICDYEDDFYRFDSNGTVLHIPSGFTYPMNMIDACHIDPRDAFHLSEIDNDDWWDTLTENEKNDLTKIYKP